MFENIIFRLQEWGKYNFKCIQSQSPGYASRSSFDRAFEGSHSTAPIYPPDNERAEEIEKIVLILKRKNYSLFEVINCEYTAPGSQREKIIKNGFNRTNYKINLKLALSWIDSMLTIVEKLPKSVNYSELINH
jgi:hypothetical protein